MCLGIPGKIVDTYEKDTLPMGKIDFGGIIKEVCLAYVPEATVGEYALVHVGFAISLMNEEEALETLNLINEVMRVGDELGEEQSESQVASPFSGAVPGI
jgi:hydrogenase expression/formation protein HypC